MEAQWADLQKLLVNPVSFGLILSMFWEKTPFFKDDKRSPYAKMGVILLSCLVWAFAVALLSETGLPTTLPGWGKVLAMAVGVAASTQAIHLVLNKAFPWLAEFLDSFTPTKTTLQIATTTSTGGATTSMDKTVVVTNTPEPPKPPDAPVLPPDDNG